MEKLWTDDSHRILEQATGLHRYNRWLMSHFDRYFGKAILEIGSGQGALSKLLPSKAIVALSDVIPEYIARLKKVFTDPVLKLDIEKEAPRNLVGKMDTIFSSNVFEHIKDDLNAFKNCYKLLKKEGRLLLFVPACPEIYGRLDKEMGHYRRYTKKELRKKAELAGLKVEKIYYANLPGYFLWWGRGRLLAKIYNRCHSRPEWAPGCRVSRGESIKIDSILARIFDTLIVPLLYLEKYLHPLFGQSLVLVARKP